MKGPSPFLTLSTTVIRGAFLASGTDSCVSDKKEDLNANQFSCEGPVASFPPRAHLRSHPEPL
jgi:hypothetical protein